MGASDHYKRKIQEPWSRFEILQQIQDQIYQTIYSSSRLSSLAEDIIATAISLDSSKQTPEQKKMIDDIFTPEIRQKVRSDTLFHDDIKTMILKDKKMGKGNDSRIYHTIANLKKGEERNSYESLSEEQIAQVVHLEMIAQHITELGEKVNFKLKEMKQESDQMREFLNFAFLNQNYLIITKLKYDLEVDEVRKVAKIAREGSDHHDDAVFLLLTYFIQACKRIMGDQGKTKKEVQQFEEKIVNLIQILSEQYPPGEKPKSFTAEMEQKLRKFEEEKGEFHHPPQPIQGENKLAQLNDIIIRKAQVAKDNKGDFQLLIRSACLDKSISYKLGLKLNDPKNPNPKTLTRIQEKMLFAKKQEKKDQHQEIQYQTMSFSDFLKEEDTNYKKSIEKLLSLKESITFDVLDMLRAKCTFLTIEDIIQTVANIKQFVHQHKDKFRVIKIQNRFTLKPIPISDVVLKIVVNEAIIAELQLTLQTNAATYNFAHKIYELQRSKIFSKVKMIHNFYQEYQKEFLESVNRCCNIFLWLKPSRQYFEMTGKDLQVQTLEKLLDSLKKENKQITLQECQNFKYQQLMKTLFQMRIEVPEDKQKEKDLNIGKLNPIFQNNEQSDLQKAVLLQQLNKDNTLNFLYPRISGLVHQLKEGQHYQGSLVNEYMGERFGLDPRAIDKWSTKSAKAYFLVNRVNNFFQYDQQNSLQFGSVLMDVVMGEKGEDNIIFLLQAAELLYHQHKHQESQRYVNWLYSIVDKTQENRRLQIDLLQAQILIQQQYETAQKQKQQYQKAQLILEQIRKEFVWKQQFRKVAQCDLWLIICSGDLKEKEKEYLKYLDNCKVQCLELRGAECADQEWLLAKATNFNSCPSPKVFETHFGKAVKAYSQYLSHQEVKTIIWAHFTRNSHPLNQEIDSQDQSCFYLIFHLETQEKDQIYKQWPIEKLDDQSPLAQQIKSHLQKPKKEFNPQILELNQARAAIRGHQIKKQGCFYLNWANCNQSQSISEQNILKIEGERAPFLGKDIWVHLQSLNLERNDIGNEGCLYLSFCKWTTLTQLNLQENSIDERGCQHLTTADWPNLTQLNLGKNYQIGNEGCKHLKAAKWKNLTQLNLQQNNIEKGGCQHLTAADWPNLTHLNLESNKIDQQECKVLAAGNWESLTHLNLSSNKIKAEGCKELIQAKWPNLAYLNLGFNDIGDEGCKHLITAKWKLTHLNLEWNLIRQKGFEQLTKANWNLTHLNLGANDIQEGGCQLLSTANWPSLTQLNLNTNRIGQQGCLNLVKAKWFHLAELNLDNNEIGDLGCEHLSTAPWQNLTDLSLKQNQIGEAGCLNLTKAKWKNLAKLDLSKDRRINMGDRENNIADKEKVHQLLKKRWPPALIQL